LFFHKKNIDLEINRFVLREKFIRAIVLKPGPARRVDPGQVEEKTREEKTRCDPDDPAG
jgi:hypothetical protein